MPAPHRPAYAPLAPPWGRCLGRWANRLGRNLLGMALLAMALYLYRYDVLRALGDALVHTNPPTVPTTTFVLSGGPFERGRAAAELYHRGLAAHLVCTGESMPPLLKEFGLPYNEAETTREVLCLQGVPTQAITVFPHGTSTLEEIHLIRAYAARHGLQRVAIVSTRLHTRRIHRVCQALLAPHGLQVHLVGACPDYFDPDAWWRYEAGLLFVNNEYMKLLYYRYIHGI